jgi:acyl dehydratase
MQLYLDDLQVGMKFQSGEYTVTEEAIKKYALEFDPQPFHLDEAAAEKSLFRGLAASGWHTAGITMRLLVTSGMPLAGGLVGAGGEIEWPRPTRPGDVLHVESEILEIIPSKSKPNQGFVRARSITFNQKQEPVQTVTVRLLSFKRPTDS